MIQCACGKLGEEICAECAALAKNRIDDVATALTPTLTGAEIAQLTVQHEALVVNMSLEQIRAHIADIKGKIERFRVMEGVSRRRLAQAEVDEMVALTPEERVKFQQLARKPRETKPKAESKPKGSKMDKAIASLQALGLSAEQIQAMLGKG